MEKKRFIRADNTHGNVCVGFQSDILQLMLEYANRYRKAANLLVESINNAPFYHDYDGCVIAFLYRHAIELYLKAIVQVNHDISLIQDIEIAFPKSHDLEILLSIVKVIVIKNKALPTFESHGLIWDDVEIFIKELNEIDRNSETFRYPIDKKGIATRSKNLVFNIIDFANIVEKISAYFYNLGDYLNQYIKENVINMDLRDLPGTIKLREDYDYKNVRSELSEVYDLLTEMPNDFFVEGRKDLPPQYRKFFE
jgi:hypothetical protein